MERFAFDLLVWQTFNERSKCLHISLCSYLCMAIHSIHIIIIINWTIMWKGWHRIVMLSFTFECAHAIKLTHISPQSHTQAHKRIHTHTLQRMWTFFSSSLSSSTQFRSVLFAVVQKCCSIARRLHSLVERSCTSRIYTSFDDNQSYLACSRATDQTGWSCESLARSVLPCAVCVHARTQTHRHTCTHSSTLIRSLTRSFARSHSMWWRRISAEEKNTRRCRVS